MLASIALHKIDSVWNFQYKFMIISIFLYPDEIYGCLQLNLFLVTNRELVFIPYRDYNLCETHSKRPIVSVL